MKKIVKAVDLKKLQAKHHDSNKRWPKKASTAYYYRISSQHELSLYLIKETENENKFNKGKIRA